MKLIEGNQRRSYTEPEYELLDTGVFDQDRYFDVFVEYAKCTPEDILIRISAVNRRPETAIIDLLPTIWFRNTWSWGLDARKPRLGADRTEAAHSIRVSHFEIGERWFLYEGAPELLFTDNETNFERLFGVANHGLYDARTDSDGLGELVDGIVRELSSAQKCSERRRRNERIGGKQVGLRFDLLHLRIDHAVR